MQTIEFMDGTKREKEYKFLRDALGDAMKQDRKNPIKKVTVTRVIPKKRKR